MTTCGHRFAAGDAVLFCILTAGHDGPHRYTDDAWDAA